MFTSRESSGIFRTVIVSLITSLGVAALLFFFATGYITKSTPTPQIEKQIETPQPQKLSTEIVTGSTLATTVVKNTIEGVTGISVLKADSGSIFDQNAAEKWGVGSGVIVSSNGYILTNNHVAGGKNKRIIVSLHDGRNLDGVTMWADPVLDLAIVKINAQDLKTIPFGNANNLQVGEPAIAIGNPLGLQFQRTVTSGIISALNRTIKIGAEGGGANYMEDLIQTDASINPGNSGGPLINSNGEVVGINTIKVSSAEGLGFAVPINVAIPIIKQYVANGDFVEPYIGVFAYDKAVIPYLDSNIKLDNGIYIAHVDEAGPAAASGIKVGCIITQVDGVNINTMLDLRTYIYSKKPGDLLKVTHISNGVSEDVNIRLAAKEKDGLVTR